MSKLKLVPVFILILLSLIFFKSYILQGKLPVPSDTIVGLYYPFREIYFKTNPNGIPYKNFLITDPVRQQYPWRNLSIEKEKSGELPLWNPYNFAGTPLLANFQSAVFYPLNLLFFFLPFDISWSILIFLQPLLAGVFLFYYLNNLKLKKEASLIGAISFSFSGFFIAWLEWGTVLNTALWLPLVLLSIDKSLSLFQKNNIKYQISNIKYLSWPIIFVLSLVSSFFAGHLQTFVYLAVFSALYFLARFLQSDKSLKVLVQFLILTSLFLILTFIQWFPTLRFILLSARNVDLPGYTFSGWFIPWQNLIQFIAPDFFGNPATLNYYGVWNYAEFIGYVGIIPLILAFFAMFFRKDKKTLFFGAAFFISLLFALPTIFAKLPFKFEFPLISTSQPTRLLFITDFSLSVLAAFGLDYFISLKNKKNIFYILGFFSLIFITLWGFILFFHTNLISPENLTVAKQNLILPTLLFIVSSLIFSASIFLHKKSPSYILRLISYVLIFITVLDLFRFGWKFEPFVGKEYLYPKSPVISFLQNQKEPFRIMSTDSRILPPNFSVMYKLQTLEGYDPLYLQRYGELMAASGRGKPDISSPFGFNRIITPQDPLSKITDFLNVKYVLSLDEIKNPKLKPVFSDGIVKIYENTLAFPRAFFVNETLIANTKKEAINEMFDINYQLNSRAIVENVTNKKMFQKNWDLGNVDFVNYGENKVILKTNNPGKGFLVLTDSYYPTWHAKIDGKETTIYLTDFNFRGIIVPKGNHTIEFYNSLF